jgi:hypothetical protein
MKKQILIPVLLFSCFIGAGAGSVVDTSFLQTNIFSNWLKDKIKTEENEEMKEESYWNTWAGRNLTYQTQNEFKKLQDSLEQDFDVFVGFEKEGAEGEEPEFLAGKILQSDKNTYQQILELRRTLSMIKVGVDSVQADWSATIRTTENDEGWKETKNENTGEDKKIDMWRELEEIMKLGQDICKKQRSDIPCK